MTFAEAQKLVNDLDALRASLMTLYNKPKECYNLRVTALRVANGIKEMKQAAEKELLSIARTHTAE